MTESEAIKVIKDNKPTSGYYILNEALDMAIQALKKQISKTSCDVDKIVEELTYESSRWKKRWSKQEFGLMDFAATTCEVIVRRNAEKLKNIAAE